MRYKFLFFWVGAGLLEFPFLEAFFRTEGGFLAEDPWAALVLHVVAASCLFFSLFDRKEWSRQERLWPTAAGFLGLVLPLFGWLAVLTIFLAIQKPSGKAMPEEELEGMEVERDVVYSPLSRRERIMGELDFIPLADILAGDDPDLKRGAVERLLADRSPEAITLLLSHRADPSPEVRFYVTSALARIKKEFDEQLEGAKEAMQKDVYKISARTFLAKTYLLYARSNLLDDVTAEAYFREAIYHLDYSIRSEHGSLAAFQMLADLHMARGEWGKAFEVLQVLGERHGTDLPDLKKNAAKIYFKTSQFNHLIEELKEIKKMGQATAEWTAVANWWGVV